MPIIRHTILNNQPISDEILVKITANDGVVDAQGGQEGISLTSNISATEPLPSETSHALTECLNLSDRLRNSRPQMKVVS